MLLRYVRTPATWAGLALISCAGPTRNGEPLPLELFTYDRTAPLAAETTLIRDSAGLRLWSVSFVSPAGGRATGYLAVPGGPGPHAGIVLQHGLPGSAERVITLQGLELAALGAVVIAVDAPWQRRGAELSLTPLDSIEQVQLVLDLQRAVDLLLIRTDVDPERLAMVGGGHGGAMGALLAGVERRLAAYALFAADGGPVAHLTAADGSPLGPLAFVSVLQRERWLAAMQPIEPLRFLPNAPPAAVLLQHSRGDSGVPEEDAEALHAAAREPRTLQWFDTANPFGTAAGPARAAWLADRIGTKPLLQQP